MLNVYIIFYILYSFIYKDIFLIIIYEEKFNLKLYCEIIDKFIVMLYTNIVETSSINIEDIH